MVTLEKSNLLKLSTRQKSRKIEMSLSSSLMLSVKSSTPLARKEIQPMMKREFSQFRTSLANYSLLLKAQKSMRLM